MNKYNIIFLDIDGVLNGYNFWNLFGWNLACIFRFRNLYRKLSNPFGVHERKVKRLAKIVHKTNSKIVMSSSWRFGFIEPYEEKSDRQKQLADLLIKYNLEVIDITPRSTDGRRDKEILSWLSRNEDKVNNYIILDDERFDLECFVGSKLVQTSSVPRGKMIKGHWYENTGLKQKHVRKAIKILNNKTNI